MSTYTLKKDFQCYEDCRMQGCPGHSAELVYYSTTDGLHYTTSNDQKIRGMSDIQTLLALLAELAPNRGEIDSLIHNAGLKLK